MEQRLGGDILPYVMGVVPPSRAQIVHLRELRRVRKEFKQAVDFILVHENWLHPLRKHVNTPSPLTRFSYMREYNFDGIVIIRTRVDWLFESVCKSRSKIFRNIVLFVNHCGHDSLLVLIFVIVDWLIVHGMTLVLVKCYSVTTRVYIRNMYWSLCRCAMCLQFILLYILIPYAKKEYLRMRTPMKVMSENIRLRQNDSKTVRMMNKAISL